MKQLFVTPFLPQKNAPQAGHRLAYDYLTRLAAETELDVLILSRTPVAEKDIEFRANVRNVYVKQVSRFDMLPSLLANPLGFTPRFYSRYTKSVAAFLGELVERNRYSTVRLEFSQCFPYAPGLRERFGDRLRIVMGVHDVQMQVVLRIKSIEGWLFARQTFALEQRLLKLADKVLVLSHKDAQLINGLYPGIRDVQVVPIPLPAFLKDVRRSEQTVKKGNILFWGAMQRRENEEALLHFVDSTFLPLRRRGLELKLFVVGSDPSERVKRLHGDDICVTGFVDNPGKYFESADIGVVPLLSGAGVKLKTLEMLAAKLPVVSTPLGAEGVEYDGNLLNVCEIDAFADVIERLYRGGAASVSAPSMAYQA
ncbi:glycosyltransferase family 4 protein [Paraburkholderia sp. MMS20-SJTR3]|uniref:Glycosyltransferase family 4 protein n=1 Tax=Paraburkholderia sejongensis TaxID=2886946 RepID=A0ABS8JQ32_9BURK|nr:glycosyltransferase [Paraburkholderia sp. MMS20-SJTR3]MCC8391854.1 glycosyltransferase family 4 protein [Paraburkholderia sp. MMS20-SJTR3]